MKGPEPSQSPPNQIAVLGDERSIVRQLYEISNRLSRPA